MKMTFAYGNDAVVLPGAVATHIERATKRDLRVLFALAAEPLIKTDVGGAVARTARTLGITSMAEGWHMDIARHDLLDGKLFKERTR